MHRALKLGARAFFAGDRIEVGTFRFAPPYVFSWRPSMKRGIVLGVLIGVGALSLAVTVAQQPPAAGGQQGPKIVEVEKLKENLFVLKGGGGNTAVFIATNGVVVVDTKNPGWGQPVLAKIKE